MTHYVDTINIGGRLLSLNPPRVMGILNVTPDSFFAGSRVTELSEIRRRIMQIRNEGADIIDIEDIQRARDAKKCRPMRNIPD